ncbi:MAG: UDP-N-acetylmuramate dehydrogenase [Pseudomonadota bacterium]
MQSLTTFHTFGFEANCTALVTINHLEELFNILSQLKDKKFLFMGEGSNTVFVEDFDGLIVLNRLKGISTFEDDAYYHVNVASGENWHEFVTYCLDNGMHGMENLALIPGTVGAAPIQNIGAYGVEVKSFIHSVEFVDIENGFAGYLNNKECEFGYRDSVFKQKRVGKRLITSVNFAIPKKNTPVVSYAPLDALDAPTPQKIFDEVIRLRQQKLPDPKVLGNAGSFFKNPEIPMTQFINLQSEYEDIPGFAVDEKTVKVPAAWLIDKLGYKGYRYGDIGCHELQPLVFVNFGKGQGEELLVLAKTIKLKIIEKFSIALENEVQVIGQYGRLSL